MKINAQRYIWTLVLAVGISTTAIGAPLFQQEQRSEQRSEPDYSHNKTYQQGQREGQADHMKNLDHSKKRHFKKDDDQKAYEAGYQRGHDNDNTRR